MFMSFFGLTKQTKADNNKNININDEKKSFVVNFFASIFMTLQITMDLWSLPIIHVDEWTFYGEIGFF